MAADRRQLEECAVNQLEELRRLQLVCSQNATLSDELLAVKQHATELEMRVARLHEKDEDISSDYAAAVESSNWKLNALLLEKSVADLQFEDLESTVNALRIQNAAFALELADANRCKAELRCEIDRLKHVVGDARKSQEQGSHQFREFVQLKRELAVVREENELLRSKSVRTKALLSSKIDSASSNSRRDNSSKGDRKPR